MRIRSVLVAVVALSFAPGARGEEFYGPARTLGEEGPKHAISLSPLLALAPLWGEYAIAFEYEAALGRFASVYVSPGCSYRSSGTWAVGLAFGGRYYVGHGTALGGFWMGGDVGVGYSSADATPDVAVTGMVGYNLLLGAFELSPGIGGSFDLAGGSVVLRLNLGYAF